ncbi:hypothetical protein [Pontibacter rugosus]|uniref:Uncharacterized protein n=1 Tax=Pontibacter rugosus TaxID=1745966 RepID=A0ABW3SKS0_9BACT
MKKLKINLMALAAVAVAAGTMAFTAPVNQEWVFTGTSQSQMKDAGHYSLDIAPPQGCDNAKPLACSIVVDATNEADLQDYLDSRNTTQLLNEATGRRF